MLSLLGRIHKIEREGLGVGGRSYAPIAMHIQSTSDIRDSPGPA